MSEIRAFELSEVRLLDGPIKERQEQNHHYLMELDPERLLHNFRVNAGLPSSAEPLGGWEAPSCGLRGHFVGHYLSACSQMSAATGDEALKRRTNVMVEELAKCQRAFGRGYLSAFPETELDAIETKFEGAWAPYYTLHKILAGLIDAHRHCGGALAMEMAVALAEYVRNRIAKLSDEQLEKMLRTDGKPNPPNEFGGMSEVIYEIYATTKAPQHLKLAQVFDCAWFIDPLTRHEDHLTGLHCNTHIPITLSAARRYELTGEARFREAAIYFWERTALARSYVNGGSSGPRRDGIEKSKGAEHWPEPNKLATTLTPKINESCVTHNMLRMTDYLFRWTADVRYAEFYERAYFNSVLCMQHPGQLGAYLYDHPLSTNSVKHFGHANDTFWCCYGTSVEAFSRLAHGIYYHNDDALWVNLFVPSSLEWKQRGLRIELRSHPSDEDISRLIFQSAPGNELKVNVRVPAWAGGFVASLNGKALDPQPSNAGSFVSMQRTWNDGDILELHCPRQLRAEPMPDDPNMIAFLYGPLVLAARTDEELVVNASDLASAVARIRATDQSPQEFHIGLAGGSDVTLVPLNEIVDERFGVYFRLRGD